MAKNKKNYLEIIHNISKRHWIVYTILVSSPTIWFTFIIPFLGQTLSLKDANGDYTFWGQMISLLVIVATVVVALLNNWYASKTEFGELEILKGKIQYLEKIMDSVDSICDEKTSQIRKIIHQVKTTEKSSPEIISNPANQLKKILESIKSCLVVFMERPDLRYSYNDFIITLAYNFPEENDEWVWLEGTIEREMSLANLTDLAKKSTFNYLRTSNKTYYFNNRKEDAKKDDRYIYDPTDETNAVNERPVGSIFCYNYKIEKGGKTYVNAILSISTQQKRFADNEDVQKIANARDNMILLVKDYFGRRINIELGLLYLDYIKNNK